MVEFLRTVAVLAHLVGFALTFGAWAAEASARRFRFTPLMNHGLLVSAVTGVALAAPWPAGIEVDYVKVGVKLALLLGLGAVLGLGSAHQRRTGQPVGRSLFALAGLLSLAPAAIAVIA